MLSIKVISFFLFRQFLTQWFHLEGFSAEPSLPLLFRSFEDVDTYEFGVSSSSSLKLGDFSICLPFFPVHVRSPLPIFKMGLPTVEKFICCPNFFFLLKNDCVQELFYSKKDNLKQNNLKKSSLGNFFNTHSKYSFLLTERIVHQGHLIVASVLKDQ